jgi:hypothetical protein
MLGGGGGGGVSVIVNPAVAESVESLTVAVPIPAPAITVRLAVWATVFIELVRIEASDTPEMLKIVPLVQAVFEPVAVVFVEALFRPMEGVRAKVGGKTPAPKPPRPIPIAGNEYHPIAISHRQEVGALPLTGVAPAALVSCVCQLMVASSVA